MPTDPSAASGSDNIFTTIGHKLADLLPVLDPYVAIFLLGSIVSVAITWLVLRYKENKNKLSAENKEKDAVPTSVIMAMIEELERHSKAFSETGQFIGNSLVGVSATVDAMNQSQSQLIATMAMLTERLSGVTLAINTISLSVNTIQQDITTMKSDISKLEEWVVHKVH